MGTNAVQRDATAKTVSANVKRLRKEQNLGLRGLSNKLGEVGRPLGHSAVDQIEKGTRRVDVDDLMALAVALGVSPVALLMPAVHSAEPQDDVESTAVAVPIPAKLLWGWLTAEYPLFKMSLLTFAERSWPVWEREQLTAQVAQVTAATKGLYERVGREEVSSGDD